MAIADDDKTSSAPPGGGALSDSDPRPIPVLLNSAGGSIASASADIASQVESAFDAAGRKATVQTVSPSDLVSAVSGLMDQPLVVIGGGDGTIGSVATAFVRSPSCALGILPLGTRNHLARQLAIPMDIPGAVEAIAKGERRAIDLGCVNEIGFVNNASIGFYPLMVRWRDEERHRHGLPKWIANFVAGWGVLRRLRHHNLRLMLDGSERTVRTPLLFVGNNAYRLEAGHVGERAGLDDGQLSVFAVSTRTRAGAVWFAARTMLGRASPPDDFEVYDTCRELEVAAHSERINVALDGELHSLESPLRFRILPSALSVMTHAPVADG